MNSVLGIGENIVFICKGRVGWRGNSAQVMSSTNEDLNDLVFASELFKKVGCVRKQFHFSLYICLNHCNFASSKRNTGCTAVQAPHK